MLPHFFGIHHLEERSLEKLILALHGLNHDVQLDGLIEKKPETSAVFGDKGHTSVESFHGIVEGNFRTPLVKLSRGGRQSHNTVGDANLAVPRQAPQAEDLPLANFQGHALNFFAGHMHP